MSPVKLYIVRIICLFLPETRCFALKRHLYRWCGAVIGKNVSICSSVRIIGNGKLRIGDNTWIGSECMLNVSSSIVIGRSCDIAPRVTMVTGSHIINYEGDSIAGEGISMDIEIEDGCWICACSTILGSSKIGRKSIVSAGSITKNQYGDNELLVGAIAVPHKKLTME